jgi:A/G-specific adenine glycosylase
VQAGQSLNRSEIAAFQQSIRDYYRVHRRSLPWRETRDPYAILVSEIMLQQTQVDRVREKYLEFIDALPTFQALAEADLSRVLSLWQGLGYNRRALSLRLCGLSVLESYGGELPREIGELESLPGIGPYTARAVAAFAFGQATPLIETNVRSVFIHHFFPDREKVPDREILPLVELTLDRDEPREWYYALMDYGSMLKRTGSNPGRRSAHHATQSPFRGSNRERRSLILRTILAMPGITKAGIVDCVGADAAAVEQNLQQLQREGFIRQNSDNYWVS